MAWPRLRKAAPTMFTAIKISRRVVAVSGNLMDRGDNKKTMVEYSARETTSRDDFPNKRLEKNTMKFRSVNRAVENTA